MLAFRRDREVGYRTGIEPAIADSQSALFTS